MKAPRKIRRALDRWKTAGYALFVTLALLVAVFVWGSAYVLRPRCIELGTNGALRIAVDRLARGQGQTYCYKNPQGEKLRFILARGSDGVIQSVFDACRRCYSAHKGYDIGNGTLICRLCGNRYPIEHMMAGMASCAPIGLRHDEKQGTVHIELADLRAGRGLF